jgi:hypothetical protein
MYMTRSQTGVAGTARKPWPIRLCGVAILVLLFASHTALAESIADQYLRIYGMVEEADALQAKGDTAKALPKYQEVRAALILFQRDNRDWNPKLVAYRLNYLAQKVAALSAPPPGPAATNVSPSTKEGQPPPKAAPAAPAVEVKLIEPGAEPRKELRFHPKPGSQQNAALTMHITLDTTIGEMPSQTVKMPAIKLAPQFTVKSVAEDGEISYEVVVREASVAEEAGGIPAVLEAIKGAVTGMQGLSGTGTLSSRGISKGLQLNVSATKDPQTRQLIDQIQQALVGLAVPLPQEAIGPGAKWEVKMPIKSQDVRVDQTVTYELGSLDGERLTLKSAATQSAANQKVPSAMMPGLKLNLIKLAGKGSGTSTADLAQIFPLERIVEVHSEQSLTMDAGGQPQPMTIKTDVKLRFEAK